VPADADEDEGRLTAQRLDPLQHRPGVHVIRP
jgi:hypothetical protein